jgi:hypothetical protein
VEKEPLIKPWYRKIASGKESTAIYYAYNLQRLLEKRKQTPKQFLAYCEKKSKNNGKLWVELRDEAYQFKPSTVKAVIKSFKSFLVHYGIFLPTERLATPKSQEHKELAYEDIKTIVNLCPEPYRTIFTIFTYAPMGEVSFIHWNSQPDMAKNVQSQLTDKKPYIKIVHPPRKNSTRKFYSLIPKQVIQNYLDRGGTLPFRNNQGNLIEDYNLQKEWKSIREGRAGYKEHKGIGVHEIRDAWFTWAGSTAGGKVEYEYRKFAIGHSDFSEQGYNKLWENEDDVYKELNKAWEARETNAQLQEKVDATRQEVTALEQENKILKEAVVSALLPQKMNLQKLLDDFVAVELRKHHLRGEAGLESLPTKYVTPAMRELDRQLENINQQLETLGWIKRVEPVRTKLRPFST